MDPPRDKPKDYHDLFYLVRLTNPKPMEGHAHFNMAIHYTEEKAMHYVNALIDRLRGYRMACISPPLDRETVKIHARKVADFFPSQHRHFVEYAPEQLFLFSHLAVWQFERDDFTGVISLTLSEEPFYQRHEIYTTKR